MNIKLPKGPSMMIASYSLDHESFYKVTAAWIQPKQPRLCEAKHDKAFLFFVINNKIDVPFPVEPCTVSWRFELDSTS